MIAATEIWAPSNAAVGSLFCRPTTVSYYVGMLCGDQAGVATPVTAGVAILRIGVVRLRGTHTARRQAGSRADKQQVTTLGQDAEKLLHELAVKFETEDE